MVWQAFRHRRTLLVPVLVLLVAPSVVATGDGEGAPPVPDVLWFKHLSASWGLTNFTTHPPDGAGYTHHPESHPDRATFTWQTNGVPSGWPVPAGTEVWLVAYVSGLDEADALLVPTGEAEKPFGVLFEAVLHGPSGGPRAAKGATVIPIDPLDPPSGIVRVAILLPVEEPTTYGEDDAFGVSLHVYARGRKYTPIRLHLQGEDAATHLVVPGFPVAGFRAWEAAVPGYFCSHHERASVPCPESAWHAWRERNAGRAAGAEDNGRQEPVEGNTTLAADAPAMGVVGVVGALLVGLLAGSARTDSSHRKGCTLRRRSSTGRQRL